MATADAAHSVSAESLDVRWWPADLLPDPQPDMVDLVRLARNRLAGLSPQSTSDSPGGGSSLAPAE